LNSKNDSVFFSSLVIELPTRRDDNIE